MVNLTGPRAASERGQILLVTTFAIAVLFVVLALVLNASAFSQAMAAGHSDDTGDAVAFSTAAADGVAGVVGYVNRHNDTSYDSLRTELEAGVADWSEDADGYAARAGSRATVSVVDTTNGTRVVQANATRSMTNATRADNWTLASDVSGTREARLNVSEDALVDPPSDPNASELRDAEVFQLRVADGSDVWRLFVYSESGDVALKVEDAGGTLSEACSVAPGPSGYAVVDLSNGSVEETACDRLAGFDDVGSSYDIAYRWGSNAAGTYTATVDRTRSTVDGTDYGSEGSDDPYVTEAVYDASIRITYETPRLEYVSETTVPRGDADA